MINILIFAISFGIFALSSLVGIWTQPGGAILSWLYNPSSQSWIGYAIAILNGATYGAIFLLAYVVGKSTLKREVVIQPPVQSASDNADKPDVETAARSRALASLDQGIEQIKGLEPSHVEKLKTANITTVKELLETGTTKRGRQTMTRITGASEKTVLEWVNRADLFRIKGIGKEYSELLNVAGVNTVVQLSRRNPENLRAKLEKLNDDKMLVKQLPSVETITEWINHAKNLKRRIEY
jgi:predicted flap endonuclease-1-like 5' DNA nuclease